MFFIKYFIVELNFKLLYVTDLDFRTDYYDF